MGNPLALFRLTLQSTMERWKLGAPTLPHQWQFLNSYLSVSFFLYSFYDYCSECILLLLLSVIVVLRKPLVIFYKDRCKNFIPCIKSLDLTTSFWICVEHFDLFDKRLCRNLLSATAEEYLKRSLYLLHRTLCPLKKSHYYERVPTAWKVVLGDLGSTLFSCWKLGIWLPGRNVFLYKRHSYLSRRRVERLSITPPTYLFYLN